MLPQLHSTTYNLSFSNLPTFQPSNLKRINTSIDEHHPTLYAKKAQKRKIRQLGLPMTLKRRKRKENAFPFLAS